MEAQNLKAFLDANCEKFNQKSFIENDPISIPHTFSLKQDIEIMGFFASTLAWGQRITIINNCKKLIELFEHSPYYFIKNHSDNDLKRFEKFVHRTFNSTDLLFFVGFFSDYFKKHDSLEDLFTVDVNNSETNTFNHIQTFRKKVTSIDYFPERTSKHVANPASGSACKRLNMFLRWMVRKDKNGVDFGIWNKIKPYQLVCPLDVHVQRIALSLGLISNDKSNWQSAIELTDNLKIFCPEDPVKYDFALFGIGIESKNAAFKNL